MNAVFLVMALVTLAGAVAAMASRQMVHCALGLVVALAGTAALYLRLGAQFVSFAQVLVYIGAVAILIVFAILLTRNAEMAPRAPLGSRGWLHGPAIAVGMFATLAGAVSSSSVAPRPDVAEPGVTVKAIGLRLMEDYVLPLEVLGLLLTAALLGAVVIALREPGTKSASSANTGGSPEKA